MVNLLSGRERIMLHRHPWLPLISILIAGLSMPAVMNRAYAQAARPDAAKKPAAKSGDAQKPGDVPKPAAAQAESAKEAEPAKKADAAGTQAPTTDNGQRPDPLRQLKGQYARRAAAKSKEREEATKTPPPESEIHEPVLALSQGHRDLCLVFVGDALPDATLPDAAGETHELRSALGEKLTVVLLWSADNPYALDQFQELQHEVVPLSDQGVHAIAVHVGAPPEDYDKLCADNGEGALCLLDADRSYYDQLARAKLPRTYLLDAQGKILWLDLEYSRSTRYDLRNALHYYLKK